MKPSSNIFWLVAISRPSYGLASYRELQRTLKPEARPIKIPGDSPAYHVGNPSNNTLVIENIDLVPNPPTVSSHIEIALTGRLKRDISPNATLSIFVTLNGTHYVSDTCTLCDCFSGTLFVWQGKRICPPKEGDVFISEAFDNGIPTWGLLSGYYGVRTLMKDADESRIAEFEGELWIESACEPGSEPPCCPVM